MNDRVKTIETAPDISSTIHALLDGIDDNAFVYWCIDDRYPTEVVDREVFSALLQYVSTDPPVDQIQLYRAVPHQGMISKRKSLEIGGMAFRMRLKDARFGFWHHQFMRARVLRRYFCSRSLGTECFDIRRIQSLLPRGTVRERVLVPDRSVMHFAEPCINGHLTLNGVQSLLHNGLKPPQLPNKNKYIVFDERKKHILDKRLIFCVNSGRCGSNFLAKLIGTAERTCSFHEPQPTTAGHMLKLINDKSYSETRDERDAKCHSVHKALRALPPGGIYCETNHMFIKTFHDVAMKRWPFAEVVILRRDITKVLKSFIELGYFSEDRVSFRWMSSPNAVTAAIKCPCQDSEMDQYDLCISYLIDIEARAQRFKQQYQNARIVECRIESLSNRSNVAKFFDQMQLTPTSQTWQLCGKKINERSRKKQALGKTTTLEYCQSRLHQYVERAKRAGITLPTSLALGPN